MANDLVKLDPEFCYPKGELKKHSRLQLMLYAEKRYGLYRAKGAVPLGEVYNKRFKGSDKVLFSADFGPDPGDMVDRLIWPLYKEEEFATDTTLTRLAPRAPDAEDAAVAVEEPAAVNEAPVQAEPEVRRTRTLDLTESHPVVVEPAAAAPVMDLGPEFERVHAHVDAGLELLVTRLQESEERAEKLLGILSQAMHLNLTIGVSILEACTGQETAPALQEKVLDMLKTLSDGLSPTKAAPAVSTSQKVQPEAPAPIVEEPAPKMEVRRRPVVNSFHYAAEDGTRVVTFAELLDESKWPLVELNKLGAEFDLNLRGLDRVKAVTVLQDMVSARPSN